LVACGLGRPRRGRRLQRLRVDRQPAAVIAELVPSTRPGQRVIVGALNRHSPRANPKERAKVYADLGVTLTYRPDDDVVDVQAVPVVACAYERVGGAITPICTRVLRGVISLR
jgi:hypothetical protein